MSEERFRWPRTTGSALSPQCTLRPRHASGNALGNPGGVSRRPAGFRRGRLVAASPAPAGSAAAGRAAATRWHDGSARVVDTWR